MKRKLALSITVLLGLFLLSALAAPVSHAESIDAAEMVSVTCENFLIGTRSDLGWIDFKFELQRTNPLGPVVLVTGSFEQTVAKPTPQITVFPWGDFAGLPYVLADGTLAPGDYVIVNSPQDDPVGRTATLVGFNTIPLHYSAGPIFCEGDEGEGCTPGYWKQPQHFDSWVGYDPGMSFSSVFGRTIWIRWMEPGNVLPSPVGIIRVIDPTLLQALYAKGGGINALARHTVAALLNASSPDIEYAYSETEVVQMFQDAFDSRDFEPTKDMFELANESFCPVN